MIRNTCCGNNLDNAIHRPPNYRWLRDPEEPGILDLAFTEGMRGERCSSLLAIVLGSAEGWRKSSSEERARFLRSRCDETTDKVIKFMSVCQNMYQSIRGQNPDVVLLPLRGAAPLGWVFEVFAHEYRTSPLPTALLPVGSFFDPNRGELAGLTAPQKKAIVEETLRNLVCAEYPLETVVLLDEVQSGGTISQITEIVSEQLEMMGKTKRIHVYAASDTRVNRPKAVDYLRLQRSPSGEVTLSEHYLPVFHVDQLLLLDRMIALGGLRDSLGNATLLRNIVLVPNEDARRTYLFLTRALFHPRALSVGLVEAGIFEPDHQLVAPEVSARGQDFVPHFVATLNDQINHYRGQDGWDHDDEEYLKNWFACLLQKAHDVHFWVKGPTPGSTY